MLHLLQRSTDRQTTKGCGGDLIIIDEAAYINQDLFYETICPLLEMKVAAMIAISTPLDSFNFFSKLVRLKDEDGSMFFNVKHLGMVCDECLKKPSQEDQLMCPHKAHCKPPWKSSERAKRYKRVTMAGDTAARGLRENLGIISDDYNTVFGRPLVDPLFDEEDMPTYSSERSPKRIYVVCDPDGGGLSRMSIMSGYRLNDDPCMTPGTLIITGIDAKSCSNHIDQRDALLKHIRKIRMNRHFERVPIIFVPENQTGFFHTQMEEYVSEMPSVRTLYQGGSGKAGVRKDKVKTSQYVTCVEDELDRKNVFFEKEWITSSRKRFGGSKRGVLNELHEEILRYCYDEKGKLTGKINGMQDDLYVAFAMLCFWSRAVERPGAFNVYAGLKS